MSSLLLQSTLVFLLLCVAHHVHSQKQCPMITARDLGSTTTPSSRGLIVATYNPAINPSSPTILIDDFAVVCLAAGVKRDTYRFTSVVVRQVCSGVWCNRDTEGQSVLVQYDFECSNSGNSWLRTAFGSVSSVENPTATLDSKRRTNCSSCAGPEIRASDAITHCSDCALSCDEGAKLCHGFGASDCCLCYDDDICVDDCPSNKACNEDFKCVIPKECPILQDPDDGSVEYNQQVRFNPNTANYTCDEGFDLEGMKNRTCLTNGSWSYEDPTCASSGSSDSAVELGIIIGVVVVFFAIAAGVCLLFVAVWACNN